MRKNNFLNIAAALWMGAAALAMTACSSEDNIVSNDLQQNAEVHTYTVSIPATFGDDAQTRAVDFDNSGATPAIITKFVVDEKVHVYNKSTSTLLEGYLEVKNVSADKKSCELQGQLTGTINADDEVMLLYNLTTITGPGNDVWEFYYDYRNQLGTAASCVDGATSTMKVKAIDATNNYKMTFYAVGDETNKTQAKALFTNLQSIFRFQFADATAPTTPLTVKTLNIESKNTAMATRYLPKNTVSPYYFDNGGITITPATPTSDYLYLAMAIRESFSANDVLFFWVTDDEGNEYRGKKSAPTLGFANGKYYYSNAPIALTKQPSKAAPSITWVKPNVAVAPNTDNIYSFTTDYPGSADITVANASGKDYCCGYAFSIYNKGTVRLNAINAIWNYQDSPFILVENGDLHLELTGDNTISCNAHDYAIKSPDMKISCTGSSATLTVKSKTADGLRLTSVGNFNVANLAADGYTVTRTGGLTPDEDGVYTTTYTVAGPATSKALSAVTTSEVGWRLGSDGNAYSPTGLLPTGVTAVAMITYVGSETGESAYNFTRGLALALSDATGGNIYKWETDYIDAGHTKYVSDSFTSESGLQYNNSMHNTDTYPAFKAAMSNNSTAAPTGCSDWFLPSAYQWNQMINACKNVLGTTNSYKDLRNGFSSVGGTNLQSLTNYWSSTEYNEARAWYYDFNSGLWGYTLKINTFLVRSAIAF